MLSGDELVCTIASNSVRGIVVLVDEQILNRPPEEQVTLCIIAESGAALGSFCVRSPLPIDQDLGVVAQTTEMVRDHVAQLKSAILDGRRGPVRSLRQRPEQRVTAGLEHAQALPRDLGQPRDPLVSPALVVVPLTTHEGDPRGRVCHDRVYAPVRDRAEQVKRVAVEDDPLGVHRASRFDFAATSHSRRYKLLHRAACSSRKRCLTMQQRVPRSHVRDEPGFSRQGSLLICSASSRTMAASAMQAVLSAITAAPGQACSRSSLRGGPS